MCRSHGVDTRFGAQAWTASRRPSPYYPDAVTLVEQPDVDDILRRIDGSAGCSMKDSFASLDLSGDGFRVLFEADWIYRGPGPPDAPGWEPDRKRRSTWALSASAAAGLAKGTKVTDCRM